MLFLPFTILFYLKWGIDKIHSVGQIWPTTCFLRLGANSTFTLLKCCLKKKKKTNCDRECVTLQSLRYLHLALYRKHLPTPDLKYFIRSTERLKNITK